MKRLLFAIGVSGVLLSGWLLWENYQLRAERVVMQYGMERQQMVIDSLREGIGWERWADTVDDGVMARGHY